NQFCEDVVLQIAPGQAQGAGLGLRNGLRSVSQNVIDNPLACGVQLSNWHDLVNEPDAMSFFNIKTFSSERVAPYLAHADGIVELWDNDGAGDPDAHLCYRENSVIGGNHDVTSGDHSGAATETGALHQGYRGDWKHVEPLNRLRGHPGGAQIVLRRRASDSVEPIDVGASLKIASVAGDYGHTQRFAGELIKRYKQRSNQVAIISVVNLRPI